MCKDTEANRPLTKLALVLAVSAVIAACGQQKPAAETEASAPATTTEKAETMEAITELQITDIAEGDGAIAEKGQQVAVHYTGWLYQPGEPDNKG